MNSDLAYFDVSHNIEILHINDSNEFENEINKQLERKIEPMEPAFETLNLGDDENLRLIKWIRKERSQKVAHRISSGVCMVLWRYAWY